MPSMPKEPFGVLLLAALCNLGCGAGQSEAPEAPGTIVKAAQARVVLAVGGPEESLELHLTNPDSIRNLIQEPIQKAEIDRKPATYVVQGSIWVKYADGSELSVAIFHPFGHFKNGEKYFIADFGRLKKTLLESIKAAEHRLK